MLFSVLEQTHCTLVASDSEQVTVAFYITFSVSIKVVHLDVTWLVPNKTAAVSVQVLCSHTATMHKFTMSLHAVPHT